MNKPSWELLARVFLFQGLQTEEIQVLCEAKLTTRACAGDQPPC